MDGQGVDTSPLQRLAASVRAAALRAGYDIDKRGTMTKLANDAGMSLTTLSRLLSAERMPDTRYLASLATAMGTTVDDLLTESDNYPQQTAPQESRESVGSRPLTPDEVADSWGVDRADVRAMFEILRKKPASGPNRDQEGRAEAQG
jgi:transcriptional regulator with XRE-family HTH domain